MDNSAQRRGMVSPSGTSLFSCRSFVAVAAMVAAAAVSLLSGLGAPQTVLPAPDRVALVVMVMSLAKWVVRLLVLQLSPYWAVASRPQRYSHSYQKRARSFLVAIG